MKNVLMGAVAMCTSLFCLSACSDEPVGDNYYTFTGEMVSDYLDHNPEKYSDFTKILHRSGLYGMMATYGNYTCFAPTNDAVQSYLRSRGMSSVDDLTDADCDTLSWNHIINEAFFTTDLADGNIPVANMNERYLTFSCDSDAVNNGNVAYFVNMSSKLIIRDDSVENGVVHTLDHVIQPSNSYLPELMEKDRNISIFVSALNLVGLKDTLFTYIDKNYTCGADSVNLGVIMHRANEDWNCKYIGYRAQRFTALVETDKVLASKGINNLEDLKAYAKQVYDTTYPEDAGLYDNDWKNPKNPLRRFISYHILPYYAAINDFTISESGIDYKTTCAMPNLIDCTDWYTTMCPGTILKMSSPSEGLFANRKGVGKKYSVRGVKVYTPTEMKGLYAEGFRAGEKVDTLNQQALNGIYHYIDDVLVYDVTTRDVVFNDRIRWDIITMSPEFLNAGTRGIVGRVVGLKQVEGWDFHGKEPQLAVRNRNVWNASYSDAVDLVGQFDVTFKIPPLPANTYEIRFSCGAHPDRGVVQVYFGEKDKLEPMGLPIDFTVGAADPTIGWVADTDDEEDNRAIDKAMHNRGYMKEMDSWNQGGSTNLRSLNSKYRKILVTQSLDPSKQYYLRIKLVIENAKAELPINYFEFCPKSVYAGVNAEDTH